MKRVYPHDDVSMVKRARIHDEYSPKPLYLNVREDRSWQGVVPRENGALSNERSREYRSNDGNNNLLKVGERRNSNTPPKYETSDKPQKSVEYNDNQKLTNSSPKPPQNSSNLNIPSSVIDNVLHKNRSGSDIPRSGNSRRLIVLQMMFPEIDDSQLVETLSEYRGDIQKAVERLLKYKSESLDEFFYPGYFVYPHNSCSCCRRSPDTIKNASPNGSHTSRNSSPRALSSSSITPEKLSPLELSPKESSSPVMSSPPEKLRLRNEIDKTVQSVVNGVGSPDGERKPGSECGSGSTQKSDIPYFKSNRPILSFEKGAVKEHGMESDLVSCR